MCSTGVYCSKQTGSSNKPSPIISSISGIGQKTVDAAKICGGAENVKQAANIRKWVVVYYFEHLYSAEHVCVLYNNCMSCPSIPTESSIYYVNILLGSPQLFLHSDQPLSEGEIIPFSGVCQSGGGCIIHAGGNGGFTHD